MFGLISPTCIWWAGGASVRKDHFSTLGGLLEGTIRPAGPYIILLWTSSPEEAPGLRKHLDERLEGVTKPFAVRPLAKSDFLDNGDVRNPDALVKKISDIIETLPQLGALVDWERRVLGATGDTVSSLLNLAAGDVNSRSAELGRILARLGVAAVGGPNVADDPFRAVNEALFPILADHVANLRSHDSQNALWQRAINVNDRQKMTAEQAARLNDMAHIAQLGSTKGCERGAVITLPERLDKHLALPLF